MVKRRSLWTVSMLAIALSTCLLSACATDPIETSGSPAALPAFRTFKLQEERLAFGEHVTEAQRAQASNELRLAAVSALQNRGYREVTGDAPADVLVVLGAVGRTVINKPPTESEVNRHITPVNTSVFDASRDNSARDTDVDLPEGVERDGDLVLYLLDPKTQRSLWRANSSGSATTAGEAMRKARATYRAMAKMLPPASGGSQ